MNKKIYAVFEGGKIIKMSTDMRELINYKNSFDEQEKKRMIIVEKDLNDSPIQEWRVINGNS